MKAYIKISKKDATEEELKKVTDLLDKAGLKYYIARDIEP